MTGLTIAASPPAAGVAQLVNGESPPSRGPGFGNTLEVSQPGLAKFVEADLSFVSVSVCWMNDPCEECCVEEEVVEMGDGRFFGSACVLARGRVGAAGAGLGGLGAFGSAGDVVDVDALLAGVGLAGGVERFDF